jgi:hypothetical protein
MNKKKKKTPYQLATERMERETNRALSHVKNLEKLYLDSLKRTQPVAK